LPGDGRVASPRARLDPWTKGYLATAVEVGPTQLSHALREEAMRIADRRLKAIASTLPPQAQVESAVLGGDIATALAADAEAEEVEMVLIGARKGPMSATSLGFSTAISLIMEAPCPIMVLNESARLDFAKRPLRLVVADDLSESSLPAVRFSLSLAERLHEAVVYHVHVETFGELTRTTKDLVNSVGEKPVTLESLEHRYRETEQVMRERAGGMAQALETHGKAYHLEIVSGQVVDELEKTACSARADLAIFGQHEVFHKKPLHVGQVPFKAMLSQSRAVVVVPQR